MAQDKNELIDTYEATAKLYLFHAEAVEKDPKTKWNAKYKLLIDHMLRTAAYYESLRNQLIDELDNVDTSVANQEGSNVQV